MIKSKKQNTFRVDITRPLKPVGIIHGLPVVEDSGLNYVDVYFPDGTQRTWGYIGRELVKGAQFAPLSGCKQALADMIQAEINKQLGCDELEAAKPPATDGPDEEESEDE